MAGYYPSGCDDPFSHSCDPCEPREYGRVRSAGFIHKDFTFTDPSATTEWQAGIQSGAIIVIPETNGDIAKGAAKMGPGYGETTQTLLGYDFSAKVNDPNFASNFDFYNSMIGKRDYKFFYRTSTKVFITDVTVTIIPNTEVKNDLNAELVWELDIKWVHGSFPKPNEMPAHIFDTCFTAA